MRRGSQGMGRSKRERKVRGRKVRAKFAIGDELSRGTNLWSRLCSMGWLTVWSAGWSFVRSFVRSLSSKPPPPEFVDSRFQHAAWPWPRRTTREVTNAGDTERLAVILVVIVNVTIYHLSINRISSRQFDACVVFPWYSPGIPLSSNLNIETSIGGHWRNK